MTINKVEMFFFMHLSYSLHRTKFIPFLYKSIIFFLSNFPAIEKKNGFKTVFFPIEFLDTL